jgi:two-component system CheB/CheR fusion protein
MESTDRAPASGAGVSQQEYARAIPNILEDFVAERERLAATQRALLNILDDASGEKSRLQQTERAIINILGDLEAQNAKVEAFNRELRSEIAERHTAEQALIHSNAELREAKERLEEADRRKDEFLAVLSHELRNPLAPIRNSLYVLDRAAPGGETAQRAHAVIERQVSQITRLVGDLLDVSRISRGKIQIQREHLDLREVLGRTLEDHRSLFLSRGIELRAEQPERPVWINGDAARLAQSLGNLLQNAAKFTPAGGQVWMRLEREGKKAVLRVRDTGVGIEPEMMVRLFQPFTQADSTLARSAGGLGLGLALVKGLIELHGGEVEARSEGSGRGSEFTIRLPCAEPEPAHAARRPQKLVRPRAQRVLVIEDNADAAESLKEALEFDAYEVELAFTGPEGLQRAREFGPDVVLCDIGLPGMDGYDVARAFRADEKLHDIALVALTGYALAEDQRKAADAGFDRHLAKPPDLPTLERILAELTGA